MLSRVSRVKLASSIPHCLGNNNMASSPLTIYGSPLKKRPCLSIDLNSISSCGGLPIDLNSSPCGLNLNSNSCVLEGDGTPAVTSTHLDLNAVDGNFSSSERSVTVSNGGVGFKQKVFNSDITYGKSLWRRERFTGNACRHDVSSGGPQMYHDGNSPLIKGKLVIRFGDDIVVTVDNVPKQLLDVVNAKPPEKADHGAHPLHKAVDNGSVCGQQNENSEDGDGAFCGGDAEDEKATNVEGGRKSKRLTTSSWWSAFPSSQHNNSAELGASAYYASIVKNENEKDFACQHPAPWLISSHWAPMLLMQCAQAISQKQMDNLRLLTCILTQLASSNGDKDQRVASWFLEALQCRVAKVGHIVQKAIFNVTRQRPNFDRTLCILRAWREVCPITAFGQVAANAAIVDAFTTAKSHILHVVDISNWTNVCLQWPTLIEALANRPCGPPQLLRLSVVIPKSHVYLVKGVFKGAGRRLESFARRLRTKLEFRVVLCQTVLWDLSPQSLAIDEADFLVFNLCNSLQTLSTLPLSNYQCTYDVLTPDDTLPCSCPRDMVLRRLQSCCPSLLIAVEDDVDQLSPDFAYRFAEFYRFGSAYLGSLEHHRGLAFKQRQMEVEKVAKIKLIIAVACDFDDQEDMNQILACTKDGSGCTWERREKACMWSKRFRNAGFVPRHLCDDVVTGTRAFLRPYASPWSVQTSRTNSSIPCGQATLTWRHHQLITFTAWHCDSTRALCDGPVAAVANCTPRA